MLRDIFGMLMDRTPRNINIDVLESGIKGLNRVQNIHDLHVWAITVGKLVLSCQIVAEPGVSSNDIARSGITVKKKTYKIHHITIQIE